MGGVGFKAITALSRSRWPRGASTPSPAGARCVTSRTACPWAGCGKRQLLSASGRSRAASVAQAREQGADGLLTVCATARQDITDFYPSGLVSLATAV